MVAIIYNFMKVTLQSKFKKRFQKMSLIFKYDWPSTFIWYNLAKYT